MANQRPIRRGRIPFRRGRRWLSKALHPVRWLDCNSTRPAAVGTCSIQTIDIVCEPDDSPVQMLYGDTDWDWSDSSEVRIDRIIGTLSGRSEVRGLANATGSIPPWIVRFGILAIEETDFWPTLDLFDPEILEEYQWMWLHQSVGNSDIWFGNDGENTAGIRNQTWDIDFDVRTRRKLGKKDGIYLYKQCKWLTSINPTDLTALTPTFALQARAIVRS